ncbi:MAG: TatD family hydrolase, partial [Treponemataceae bacterium]|nr:TatD family hydrolase [Treponemataceae bacterium]
MREDENFSRISILKKMAQNGCKFALDVGVKADDFFPRIKLFEEELSKIENPLRKKIEEFIFFSAGIWPDPDSIKNRAEKISLLEKTISEIKSNSEKSDSAEKGEGEFSLGKKLVALGECGLDHHWNVAGPDARSEADFDQDLLFGERELFEAQISLAKKFSLPVIVHSRDAAAQTLECVKSSKFHNGIIHCFSYGLEEARAFLDLGWHISFSGSVTYTKKSKFEQMRELIRFVPEERLLVETDAQYLAP